eukprot:CAMPEP_0170178538 /NCGR_PEP_ID=MMETSP0040_2-20121228/11950_1 /TAXON_ID=641309 /ORGANISM="Lotharella oceanica, Strain CCMP622" /LENGTH=143 /DNA_ID=CAMNT_0010421625 /DNA_START=102 /DNA_END=534 /DNA_ORIENTATION=-
MRAPRSDDGSEDEKPEIDRTKRFASEVKMLRLARSLALSDLRKSQAAELVSLQKRHARAIADVKDMYNRAIGSPLLSLKALYEAEETTVCPGCLQSTVKTELYAVEDVTSFIAKTVYRMAAKTVLVTVLKHIVKIAKQTARST